MQFKATQYSFIESSYNVFSIILGVLFIPTLQEEISQLSFLLHIPEFVTCVFIGCMIIKKPSGEFFIPLNKSFIIQISSMAFH
ncbi:MAG: hypothetical protein R2847_11455 [Bacteroidia bacterium]